MDCPFLIRVSKSATDGSARELALIWLAAWLAGWLAGVLLSIMIAALGCSERIQERNMVKRALRLGGAA